MNKQEIKNLIKEAGFTTSEASIFCGYKKDTLSVLLSRIK